MPTNFSTPYWRAISIVSAPSMTFSKKKRPGESRLAPMPPTTAARWITISGLRSAYIRSTSAARVRSYCVFRGTSTVQPRVSSAATTCRPRKPLPPVTATRLNARAGIQVSSRARSST